MTNYNKNAFTLTTLEGSHKVAIQQYLAAVRVGDKAAEERWHNECARLERLIVAKRKAADDAANEAAARLDGAEAYWDGKEFANKQNEAMRTTDMKLELTEPLYVEDLWFKDGVAYARTPSCGCCSDVMSSEADDYDYNPTMDDLDRMAAYVEQQEAKVQALREDFNDYCNSQENG